MIPSNINPKHMNLLSEGTLMSTLGIEFIEVGENFLKAKMPVDERTFQPMGMLHGGANVALAESLGSAGTYASINTKTHYAACIEINANHIRSVTKGFVTGTATIVHAGKTTQIWNIEIKDENDKLISVSRLTMMIIERKDK